MILSHLRRLLATIGGFLFYKNLKGILINYHKDKVV